MADGALNYSSPQTEGIGAIKRKGSLMDIVTSLILHPDGILNNLAFLSNDEKETLTAAPSMHSQVDNIPKVDDCGINGSGRKSLRIKMKSKNNMLMKQEKTASDELIATANSLHLRGRKSSIAYIEGPGEDGIEQNGNKDNASDVDGEVENDNQTKNGRKRRRVVRKIYVEVDEDDDNADSRFGSSTTPKPKKVNDCFVSFVFVIVQFHSFYFSHGLLILFIQSE